MCLYNEGLIRGNVARVLIFFYLTKQFMQNLFIKNHLLIRTLFSSLIIYKNIIIYEKYKKYIKNILKNIEKYE